METNTLYFLEAEKGIEKEEMIVTILSCQSTNMTHLMANSVDKTKCNYCDTAF